MVRNKMKLSLEPVPQVSTLMFLQTISHTYIKLCNDIPLSKAKHIRATERDIKRYHSFVHVEGYNATIKENIVARLCDVM